MTAMYKIVNEGIPPLPDDISSELKDFLNNCFIRDPKKRKTATELLSHPWVSQLIENGPKPNVKLEEGEQDLTIVRSDVGARGRKHNSREGHNTQMVDLLINL